MSAGKQDFVFGAGGIRGIGHIGVVAAAQELGIEVGRAFGASAGAWFAALIMNGFSLEQIFEVLYEGVERRWDPFSFCRSVNFPNLFNGFRCGGNGFFDLLLSTQDTVEKHKLSAHEDLTIWACAVSTGKHGKLIRKPRLFQGAGCDIVKALTATCSLPPIFSEQVEQEEDGSIVRLRDGAWWHYNTTEFCQAPAIVSTIRPCKQFPCDWPNGWQVPVDLFATWLELYAPLLPSRRHVDPHKHVVIEIGLPDVSGLNYGLSRSKCEALVEDGYKTALPILRQAIEEGKIFPGGR